MNRWVCLMIASVSPKCGTWLLFSTDLGELMMGLRSRKSLHYGEKHSDVGEAKRSGIHPEKAPSFHAH
jgi:hypothetical protein